MYIDLERPTTILNHFRLSDFIKEVEMRSDKIQGHLVVFSFKDHVEIYDLCVNVIERNKKIGDKLLTETIKYIDKQIIWLGIDPANPGFNFLLPFYAKKGFSHPRPTFYTLSGIDIGFNVLGLTLQKDVYFDWKETVSIGNEMRFMCITQVEIVPFAIKKMYDMLLLDHEVGGSLTPEKHGKKVFLDIDPKKKAKGGFTVNVQPDYVTYHTHPEICYKTYGCFLGWPSGQDMSLTVLTYEKNYCHIVVTVEGLYVIKFTLGGIKLINTILGNEDYESLEKLAKNVKSYFSSIESSRKDNLYHELDLFETLQTPSEKMYKDLYPLIEKFFINVQNFTVNTVISNLEYMQDEQYDTPLFDVTLTSWNKAKNGLQIDLWSLADEECPLFS